MGEERPSDPFQELSARLAKARAAEAKPTGAERAGGVVSVSGFGAALRIGVEMVAALIVGVGFGLLLDNWLETAPLFLVVFFLLGAAAGVLNVYRAASGLVVEGGRPAARRPEDKEEQGASGHKPDGAG